MNQKRKTMITLFIRYTIDPRKVAEFESYAKTWTVMVPRYGGTLVGYYAPTRLAGPTNIAYALIQFPSLAIYETYREGLMKDPEVAKNVEKVESSGTILIEERAILR